ncbi:MAG: CoA activase [Lachnospiraceae bacterium]|nr:CoA activase [Lachnospiraceae bacterium]
MRYGVGIDIGSTCAKTIVIDEEEKILHRMLQPTGWSSVDTAEAIRADLETKGITADNARFVATGYGRISVPFADKCVTEISCHAKGAVKLFGSKDVNVVDIGGQDTKLIVITDGMVSEFVMNDKCSAGTGRFLEVMANTLSVTPARLCEMAEDGAETKISSLCTVFAESEVINLIGRGTPRPDIAYAVVDSIVQKVRTQAGKVHFNGGPLCLTGGLCEFGYVTRTLGKAFKQDVVTSPDARYAGALGAALYANALK